MYYEEKVVDGVLCWRNFPNDPWRPMDQKSLTARIQIQETELNRLKSWWKEYFCADYPNADFTAQKWQQGGSNV